MGLPVNMIIIYGEVTEYVIHPQYGQFCPENDDQLSNLFNFGVLVRYVQTSQKKRTDNIVGYMDKNSLFISKTSRCFTSVFATNHP